MDLNINSYEYEQYTSVWCKVVDIATFKDSQASELSDENIIKELIEEISMCYTPESWCGHFQLEEDTWHSTTIEHIKVADEIIKACGHYQDLEIQDAIAERDEYLSWFGFNNGMSSIKEASEEQQLEGKKLLENWYKNAVIDTDHKLRYIVFKEHEELKDKFLNQLFTENTRFYINKTAEEARVCLLSESEKRIIPAIIGLDAEKAAMLWFNY